MYTKNKSKYNGNKITKYLKNIIDKLKNILFDINNNKITQNEINLYKQYISLSKSKIQKTKINKNKTIFSGIKNKKEKYIKEIYNEYQQKLKNNNMIDFDDIINRANEIITENKNINFKYKYIIVDEYQDISENRYNLIQNISKKIKSKIIVVGDDWQCIYSFASSNINLFTNFKNNVEYCETLKIEKTYRNRQQLIDIAGEFIQKNNKQIPKKLISNKQLETPVKLITYKNKALIDVLGSEYVNKFLVKLHLKKRMN